MFNNKIFKINNYKKHLKYIYILQLIDNNLCKIYKYYNYKYLITTKLNNLLIKIKNNNNFLNKKKKKYIFKYIKNKKKYNKKYNKKKYNFFLKKIFKNYKKKYELKYLKYKYKYKKILKKYYIKVLKIYYDIIYINYKISIYNENYIKKLINYKLKNIIKINKYLLRYYLFIQKNNLNNEVVVIIKNNISFKNNILIPSQNYINLFLKKKIILNELDGTILIDFLYAKKIKYNYKKKIKKL
ncbi:MAG: hypothetical protein ABNO82_00690 [Candidatus Shikimatogenerans sp. Tder]|uniref:Uncharacterized protein n=1 Tax=Candidatus Shikimatogenerans sp. Tder TaxID=3158566 RepID=A0AAU7QR51_9FLAO